MESVSAMAPFLIDHHYFVQQNDRERRLIVTRDEDAAYSIISQLIICLAVEKSNEK